MGVLSLFAGVEGLGSKAIAAAGLDWKVQTAVEFNPDRRQYLKSLGLEVAEDVRTFRPDRSYDVVVSGSPCTQNTIAAGRNRVGLTGKDSGLWWHNIRVVRQAQPDIFIWENPTGALIPPKGEELSPLALVIASLRAIGYSSAWFSIPAWVVGAPCLRDRLFLVAVRGMNWEISKAIGAAYPKMAARSDCQINPRPIVGTGEAIGAVNALNRYINGAYRGGKWAINPFEGWSIVPPRSLPNRQALISAIGDSCIPEQAAISWKVASLSVPGLKFSPTNPTTTLPDLLSPELERLWEDSETPPPPINWDELTGKLPRFGEFVNRRTPVESVSWKFPKGEYLLPTPLARSKGTENYNAAGGDPLDRDLRGFLSALSSEKTPAQLRVSLSEYPKFKKFPYVTHPAIRSWIMGLELG